MSGISQLLRVQMWFRPCPPTPASFPIHEPIPCLFISGVPIVSKPTAYRDQQDKNWGRRHSQHQTRGRTVCSAQAPRLSHTAEDPPPTLHYSQWAGSIDAHSRAMGGAPGGFKTSYCSKHEEHLAQAWYKNMINFKRQQCLLIKLQNIKKIHTGLHFKFSDKIKC